MSAAAIGRPAVNIKGWPAAWEVLRPMLDEDRKIMVTLVRTSGLHGPAALRYLAQCLRWLCGSGKDYPAPPDKLKPADARLVEARARELLEPYRERFPRNRLAKR